MRSLSNLQYLLSANKFNRSYHGKLNQARKNAALLCPWVQTVNFEKAWEGLPFKMADDGSVEVEELEKNIDSLSHPEVMSLFNEKLAEIMSDPLLIGLPSEPTLDEVNSQIALEHGRAIVVNVRQQDERNTVLRINSFEMLKFILM